MTALQHTADWQGPVRALEEQMRGGLSPLRSLDSVADVRVLGGIGVVELHEPVDMTRIQPRFVQEGVRVRPFGRLIYIMPPYVISDSQLNQLMAAIGRVLRTGT